MKSMNIYPKLLMILTFTLLGFSSTFAQIALDLKLQLMNDTTWGVYVKPKTTINPSSNTITGSGQATIVAPNGWSFTSLTSIAGSWQQNARVNGPVENPSRDYVSFGFITDAPQIVYVQGEETLLFTIQRDGVCPDTLYLIDNATDPFIPSISTSPGCGAGSNSECTNPGNDLSVFDVDNGGIEYFYAENYAPSAWSCQDCDMDGILNALEDSNGNGTFDVGVDTSALCDICDPIHPDTATLSGGGVDVICEGDVVDTAYLIVTIVGGWTPYTVVYTDGTSNFTVNNYESGDTIKVVPTGSVTYSLVSVTDMNNCVADAGVLSGSVTVTVEGPISISTNPTDVFECSGNSNSYTVAGANAGDGDTFWQWQISTDAGATFIDLVAGTPYSNVNTTTLNISDVAGLHGYQYRAKIFTESCDTVWSTAANMTVHGPMTIDSEPMPTVTNICATDNITFTSVTNNAGAGTMNRLWQVSTDGGTTFVDLSESAPYSNVATDALTITAAGVALNGYQYRIKIFSTECDTVFSDPSLLNVEGPLSIDVQPVANTPACAGQPVTFFINASNPGAGMLSYQWQISMNGGGSWTDLNNGGIYGGTKSDTLTITDATGLDGFLYQVLVSTPNCNTLTSTSATLDIDGPIEYAANAHPDDVALCAGDNHTFTSTPTISQGTLIYQWQESTDGGDTWTDITNGGIYSGATTNSLTLTNIPAGNNQYEYKLLSSASNCVDIESEPAVLTVEGPLTITTQPVALTSACAEDPITLFITSTNPGQGPTAFQWQFRATSGDAWANVTNTGVYAGATTEELSILDVVGLDGYEYQILLSTPNCATVTSTTAVLDIDGPIVYASNAHPTDMAVCAGDNHTFTAGPTISQGSISYQWQESTDNGGTWNDITDGGIYGGATTASLTLTNIPFGNNQYEYRLLASTSTCSDTESDPAILTVEGPLAITTQPVTTTAICAGEPIILFVNTTNPGQGPTLYQWQFRATSGDAWANLSNGGIYNGTSTDSLSIGDVLGLDGYQYQVLISTANCAALTSSTATLDIDGPIEYDPTTGHPEDMAVCAGDNHTFTASPTISQGTLIYQWQESTDNGTTWNNITNGGIYSGATTASLTLTNIPFGHNQNEYKLLASAATCADIESDPAVLTVEGPLAITTQPNATYAACANDPITIFVNTTNPGQGPTLYQWQFRATSGDAWANLSNGGIYNGTSSDTLTINNPIGLDGYQYQALISTTNCAAITSSTATLDIDGPIDYDPTTGHPVDMAVCAGDNHTFTASPTIAQGTLIYQWQESIDNGTTWNNITNGGIYSGATTASLTLTNIPFGHNQNEYKLLASASTCTDIESDPAVLTVEGPLAISTDVNATYAACANDPITIFINTTNPGQGPTLYQWQFRATSGDAWANLSNGGIYNGTSSDTLTISNPIGLDGYQYQALVSTANCANITSGTATLDIDGPITFDVHPADIDLCYDAPHTFTVTASIAQGTLLYQWQEMVAGSGTWLDITDGGVYSGATTASLTLSDITLLDQNEYRVLASAATCNDIASDPALLTVEGQLSVSVQPTSVTECTGNSTNFSATIVNNNSGTVEYEWQVSLDNGINWFALPNNGIYSGGSTDFLAISDVAGFYDYQYRLCAQTAQCDTICTAPVTLTVEGPINVDLEPTDSTVCHGGDASFTTSISNSGSGTLVFQWQESQDGVNWNNLSDGAALNGTVFSGTTTEILDLSNIPTGGNGYCYRLRTTTSTCTGGDAVYTEEACITVEGPIAIVDHPDDVATCSELQTIFEVGVTNGGQGVLSYQWQESMNMGTTWLNISNDSIFNGSTTDTLSLSSTESKGGNWYRVIVWTGECDRDTSNHAILLVEGPIVYIDQPEDVEQCSGNNTTFDVTFANNGTGTPIIQWQFNDNIGGGWTDITGAMTNYSGANTTTLVVADVAGLNDYTFRCLISTAVCDPFISGEATLKVEGPISFLQEPMNTTVCSGGPVNFEVITQNLGVGNVDYQWQIDRNDGMGWVNVSNNSFFAGAQTANLSISDVAGMNGYQFQVIIQTTHCTSQTSATAVLEVEGPFAYTSMPQDVTVCSGDATLFTANATISNAGMISYQWEISMNGITWTPLANGGVYSGVDDDTLHISDVAGLNGLLYRLASSSGTCSDFQSDPAELTVEGPLTVAPADQPSDWVTCSDLGAFFFINVQNAGEGFVFYQWQESTDNGSTWDNLFNQNGFNGVTTDTMSIDTVAGLYNHRYRVRYWSESCDTLDSDAALLTVEGPLAFSDVPDDVTICSGTGTSFTVAVTNPGSGGVGGVLYQWEVSNNGGTTWSSLTDAGVYSGTTAATLNISDVAGLGGYKYRCRARTINCAEETSSSANLTVEGPLTINTEPTDQSICSNVGTTISADVTNPGQGVMTLQWEVSTDNGSSWTPLTNTGVYTGTTTEDLHISVTDGLDQNQYHLVLTSSVCTTTSFDMTLTVRDACLDGTCDFDLDGLDNDTDLDDDNDGLTDVWEDYITMNSLAMVGVQHTMDNCNPDSDGDMIPDDEEDPDEDDINNGEETDEDTVFDGDPLDPCDPVLSASCIGIRLKLRAYLQGAMIGNSISDTLMRDDLRSLALIPGTEPYSELDGFEHHGDGGGEMLLDSAGMLSVTGEDAIVDWVFVEIRSSIYLDSVITTRAALIQRDGDIIDVNGSDTLTFATTVAGPYYVAIRHRNHLGSMTVDAGLLSPILTEFDFSDTLYDASGTIPMVDVNTKQCLWAGNLNADNRVVYQGPNNDLFTMFAQVISDPLNDGGPGGAPVPNFISKGYHSSDVNMDGQTIYQGPNTDRISLLFRVVLNYSENGSQLANFVILEQLP